MTRASLTNSGEIIRPDASSQEEDSTEAETQVSREKTAVSGLMIDDESIRIGSLEIPLNVLLLILVSVDIMISAGVIFDE